MLLLASEHKAEIEPLLNLYPFRKEGNLLKYNDISIFINYGKGVLSLGFNIVNILSKNPDINISMLFGFAGAVNDKLKIGEIFVCRKVKLIHNKKPVFNPIDMPVIKELKSCSIVSLLDEYDTDNKFLGLFGDAVDKESYFFAKAVKSIGKLGLVLKIISDKNTKLSIKGFNASEFKYSVDNLKSIVERLSAVDKDGLMLEIFRQTGILNIKTLIGLKNLILKNRLTFSLRQKMYKKIVINSSKEQKISLKTSPVVLIEKDVDKNRVKLPLDKFKVIEIDDYVCYFHNLKDKTATIFAIKKGEFLRKTPDSYTPEKSYGYSILNAYNCIYDCSYCFLKGYFKSFNPVIFLNYKDYFTAVEGVLKKDEKRPLYFYAGTFSDSLTLEYFSDFNVKLMEFFDGLGEDIFLEFRTKSANIDWLLRHKATKNIIVAFSLNPQSIIDRYEHSAPSLQKRLNAVKKLDNAGYSIGIRLDPVFADNLDDYGDLLNEINMVTNLHSVEIGFLRYDRNDYTNLMKSSGHILRNLVYDNGMYRYPPPKRKKAIDFFRKFLNEFYTNMEC